MIKLNYSLPLCKPIKQFNIDSLKQTCCCTFQDQSILEKTYKNASDTSAYFKRCMASSLAVFKFHSRFLGRDKKDNIFVMIFPGRKGSKLCCLKQNATAKFADSPIFSKKQIKVVVVSFGFNQGINLHL